MIDLHMHTTNSDGTDTLEEILKKANELKLEYISITDHDNCRVYNDLKKLDIPKLFSGKIIPGIELKCSYNKRVIEVLGYKIDTDKMNKWLNKFYKGKTRADLQKKYFNILYDKCIQKGYCLSDKKNIVWNPNNDWASITIYRDLKKHKENKNLVPEDMWEDFSYFSKKYCANPEFGLYIDKSKDYPSLEEAIKGIKDCGGLAFMPHLYIYKWISDDKKEDFINDITDNYDIDGIECYYSTFTEEQTQYLLNLCEKKKLFKSGGSDYHGLNKPNISLGKGQGNLKIPKDLISNWL